jgi:hypothetical protein
MSGDGMFMGEANNGQWVKYADAQATIAELEQKLANKKKDNRNLHLLQDELVEIRDGLKADLTTAQAQIKRLGEAVAKFECACCPFNSKECNSAIAGGDCSKQEHRSKECAS